MKIKSKIAKRTVGKSAGKWVVKIEYFDEASGRTRYMERHANRRGEAVDKRNQLVEELSRSHGQSQTGEKMTFHDLTAVALRTFYQPAVLVEGHKITGVRAHETVVGQIASLNKFFGNRLIRQITTESLTDSRVIPYVSKSISDKCLFCLYLQ